MKNVAYLELAYRLREVLKSNKPLYERAWEIYISYIMANGSKYGVYSEIAKTLYPQLFFNNREKARYRARNLVKYKIRKLLSSHNVSSDSFHDEQKLITLNQEATILMNDQPYPGLAGKFSMKGEDFRTLAELLKISYAVLEEFGLKGKLLYHAQSIVENIVKEKGPELLTNYPFKTWFKKNYVKTSKYHAAFIYAASLHAIRRSLKTNHNSPPKLKAIITALTGISEKELNEALREIASLVIDLLA